MAYGNCAEALLAACFMAVVQKHWLLHGSWQWFETCRDNLDLACVSLDRMCVQVWNLKSMQNCSAPDVKQLQLLQTGQESQCGMCDVCPR